MYVINLKSLFKTIKRVNQYLKPKPVGEKDLFDFFLSNSKGVLND